MNSLFRLSICVKLLLGVLCLPYCFDATPPSATTEVTMTWPTRAERDLLFGDGGGEMGGRSRRRRTPAVWGEPAPDYSVVQLQGEPIHLYALLFVDAKISDHYAGDRAHLKAEVMKLAEEANRYFYQIDLRLIVVDIIETMRNDLTLYTFEQYRNRNIRDLPYHNFAVLVSYRYAGGLAFVSGMCSAKSVMLSGFYPHNPEAMGSIFFHEVAHLIGVPHTHPNESLYVANCACASVGKNAKDVSAEHLTPHPLSKHPVERNNDSAAQQQRRDDDARPTRTPKMVDACLRIPGFDHDCTLQLMANLVHRNRCLPKEPLGPTASSAISEWESTLDLPNSALKEGENERRYGNHKFYDPITVYDDDEVNALYSSGRPANRAALRALLDALPLCGNGVTERGEECDCGLQQLCRAWNCDAATCTRPVPLWTIYLCALLVVASIVMPVLAYLHFKRRYRGAMNCCWMQTAPCYAHLPRSSSVLRKWRQRGANWTSGSKVRTKKFFQREIFANSLGRGGDGSDDDKLKNSTAPVTKTAASKTAAATEDFADRGSGSGCDAKFLRPNDGTYRSGADSLHYRINDVFLLAKRLIFARRENKNLSPPTTTATTTPLNDSGSMKLVRVFAPPNRHHHHASSGSTTYGRFTSAKNCSSSSWSAASVDSASMSRRNVDVVRPRLLPPPPPPSSTSATAASTCSASPTRSSSVYTSTPPSASKRPKLPPPPRPSHPPEQARSLLQQSDSRAVACQGSFTHSNVVSTAPSPVPSASTVRKMLPPPPPPPPLSIKNSRVNHSAELQPNNVLSEENRTSVALRVCSPNSLPRPPSFAPPNTPPLSCDASEPNNSNYKNGKLYSMEAIPKMSTSCTASLSWKSAESLKLAPLSIMTPTSNRKRSSALIEQIEAELARRSNAALLQSPSVCDDPLTTTTTTVEAVANDAMEEDRYSISHKFADFDDDDDYVSDVDENNFSQN